VKILLVGSGGREHALLWKLAQSPQVDQLFCAPGNAGCAQHAELVALDVEDHEGLADFATAHQVDLVVIGPERPLIRGQADQLRARGLRVFGPTAAAARLEGSKSFTRELLAEHGIPSAQFRAFDDPEQACEYVRKVGAPIVVKADGDAFGKGVVVAETRQQALEAIQETMVDKVHGAAGERVVLEERLVGEECTIKVFCDGKCVVPMVPSEDHKRARDGDRGPNTGGMGCFAPVPAVTPELFDEIIATIIEPTVAAMAQRGTPYTGCLYAGLMLTERGPRLLEYNCRFGDPEAQVVLPLLQSDLAEVLMATAEGRLDEVEVEWSDEAAVCVVLASGGYPGHYEKGKVITGLEQAGAVAGVTVFHAGTAQRDDKIVTNGGRVLGVTAVGADFEQAIARAYQAVDLIHFDEMHVRRDIGKRALR